MIGRDRPSILTESDGLGEYRRSWCRLSTEAADAASTNGRYLSAPAAIGRPRRTGPGVGPAGHTVELEL
jgi:hypothetical protein